MADIIQIRRDTASAWTSANPTLASGELGLETDTGKLKVGDASTAWTSLAYYTLATAGYAPTSGNLSQFAATTSAQLAGVLSDETGTGAAVFATSPTLVTPALGTPASGVATNLTGTAANLTVGNATTLATARTIHGVSFDGSANIDLSEEIADTVGAMVSGNTETNVTVTYEDADNTLDFVIGTLNQDTTGTAATVTTNANLTGHVTSTGNAAVLGSFTSAQLSTALSDETGSGAAVFATSPTLVTPALGTPASGVLTNATGLPNSSVIGLGTAALVATGTSTGNVPLVGTKSSTTTLAGLVERSTSAENVAGTDDTVYPTVAGTKEMISTHAGGSSLSSTSTGTITAGDPLAILSTGNFQKVSGSISGAGVGAGVEFFDARPDDCVSAYDPVNNLTLTIFSDYNTSGKGTYVISRLSGTSLVCEPPVIWEAGNVVNFTLAYHAASGNFLATYTILSSGDTHAIAIDCSGGGFTFGTQVQVTNGSNTFQAGAWSCYDSVEEKVLVTYASTGTSYGYARAIGVSGTVVSVGTAHEFYDGGAISAPRCAYDPVNEKSLVVFKDTSASKFYGIPIDISGSTVTSGTEVENTTIGNIQGVASGQYGSHVVYMTQHSKFMVAATTSDDDLDAALADLDGGTLAWSGSTTLDTADHWNPFIVYDPGLDSVYIITKDSTKGAITIATTDGSTITDHGTEHFCQSLNVDVGFVFNSTAKVKEIYYWDQTNNDGDCKVAIDTFSTTATDFIGIAQSTVSTGQSITADTIGGTNDQRTGMTVGSGQWVAYNGNWSEVDTGYVRAGVAISATDTHITGAPE